MPRRSVDLDLVFPDHGLPRNRALVRIGEALQQSAERLKARGFQTRVQPAVDASETKLLVRRGPIEVKIEVNFVMRGTVNPVRMAALLPRARDVLLADLEIPVVSQGPAPREGPVQGPQQSRGVAGRAILYPSSAAIVVGRRRSFAGTVVCGRLQCWRVLVSPSCIARLSQSRWRPVSAACELASWRAGPAAQVRRWSQAVVRIRAPTSVRAATARRCGS
jgi:hypothetical protein